MGRLENVVNPARLQPCEVDLMRVMAHGADPPEQDRHAVVVEGAAGAVGLAVVQPLHTLSDGAGGSPAVPPQFGEVVVTVRAGDDERARAYLGAAPAVEDHD